ncbi:MAG TPA: hypothetical protein PKH77_17485 [Anaerolineae bacterium]|nr:hypothetical protein [Anaerolineae bacterium]
MGNAGCDHQTHPGAGSGAHTQAVANRVVHRSKAILAPSCPLVFTSDGLRLYFYALAVHWGWWVEQVGHRLPQWQVLPALLYGQSLS